MVSFMHHWALQAFIEAAAVLGRDKDATHYAAIAERVKGRMRATALGWAVVYARFHKNRPQDGLAESEEGKIFLNGQSWAVLSGVASPERAARRWTQWTPISIRRTACASVIRPTHSPTKDGLHKRVYKGIKENVSIFSHPNPWAIITETMSPGRSGDEVLRCAASVQPKRYRRIRQAEPYSYCQFITGSDHNTRAGRDTLADRHGRWMYTAATRYILGVRTSFDGLVVDPCIPAAWPSFRMTRQWRGATYHITVQNLCGVQEGVLSATLNGRRIELPIAPQAVGTVNDVVVVIGSLLADLGNELNRFGDRVHGTKKTRPGEAG